DEHDRRKVVDKELHDQRPLPCVESSLLCPPGMGGDAIAALPCDSRRISSASCSSADFPSSLAVGSGQSPRRKPMHLIRCEMPARMSSRKPTGINSLTGQRTSPPVFDDCSFSTNDS